MKTTGGGDLGSVKAGPEPSPVSLIVHPAREPLTGIYRPPGDKSISHRAAMFGALAEGATRIRGYLDSSDTKATLAAMAVLGARVETGGEGEIRIEGGRLRPPGQAIDMGNSGTGMRLLTGILAGQGHWKGDVTLVGDASLSRRPMNRVIRPLEQMGARIASRDGLPPLIVTGRRLKGIAYRLPVASAQVKSALLLAGLFAEGETTIEEPVPSRDHTERLLPAFGVEVTRQDNYVSIRGGQRMSAAEVAVPGDLSAAAFVMAAASLVPGSAIAVREVGLNPTRDGVLRVLRAMGAHLSVDADTRTGEESIGTIRAEYAPLTGIEVPEDWVPLAIDELPVIMAAAARAQGKTVIRGAGELRVKESDRLATMCAGLKALGVVVEELEDGAVITGGPVLGGEADAAGDHRIAMSLAVLGLAAENPVVIRGAEWIATSYPGFVADLAALGANMAISNSE